jgi:hypothetical protein
MFNFKNGIYKLYQFRISKKKKLKQLIIIDYHKKLLLNIIIVILIPVIMYLGNKYNVRINDLILTIIKFIVIVLIMNYSLLLLNNKFDSKIVMIAIIISFIGLIITIFNIYILLGVLGILIILLIMRKELN